MICSLLGYRQDFLYLGFVLLQPTFWKKILCHKDHIINTTEKARYSRFLAVTFPSKNGPQRCRNLCKNFPIPIITGKYVHGLENIRGIPFMEFYKINT